MSGSDKKINLVKRTVRIIFPLLTAAALLFAVFWFADLEDLAARLANADVTLLLLSLLIYSITYYSRARRFAAAGVQASTATLLCVVAIHGALNRILPLRMGELAYPWLVKRVGAAAMGEGIIQLVMLRLLDLSTIIFLFFTALIAVSFSGVANVAGSNYFFLGAAGIIGLGSFIALTRLGAILRLGLRCARWFLQLLGSRAPTKAAHFIDRANEAIQSVTTLTMAQRLRLGLWSVTCWGAYFVLFYLILQALAVPMAFLDTVLGSSAAIVGSVIPISGLGTFGALEGGWTAGFVAVGLDTSTAASSALVMSGLTLVYALILGTLGWLTLELRLRKLEKRGKKESTIAAIEDESRANDLK